MLIEVARQLGNEVDERWARKGHALDAFASVAADTIERLSPHDRFDLAELADWLAQTEDLPEQLDPRSGFEDPPIRPKIPGGGAPALPSRREVIETIKRYRDPTDPVGWLVGRLQGMIEADGWAVVINDFRSSVLRALILGRPEAEVVEAALAGEGHGQSAADLRGLCAALRQIDIVQPLFGADSGHRGRLSWSGN